jgi:hypothetical protein
VAHALPRSSNTLLEFPPKLKTSSTLLFDLHHLRRSCSPLSSRSSLRSLSSIASIAINCITSSPFPAIVCYHPRAADCNPPIHFSEQEAELLSTAQPWRNRVRQARTQIHPIIPITSIPRSSRATSTRSTMPRRLPRNPLRKTRKTRTWTL